MPADLPATPASGPLPAAPALELVPLGESRAARVLLLRAFESPLTAPWTADDRDAVSVDARRAVGEAGSSADFLDARAAQGLARLGGRDAGLVRALEHALAATHWPTWVIGVVGALAFLAGIAVDAVGSAGRIQLLAPPLLGLLGWNLVVYAWSAAQALRSAARASTPDARPRAASAGLLRTAFARALQRWRPGSTSAAGTAGLGERLRTPVVEALRRFWIEWAVLTSGLQIRRVAVVLHVAAAAVAAGAIASLYLRGLAFEFRAGWDSTFLSAEQALALLQAVLGPASATSGLSLPGPAEFAALRFSQGPGENAARWIHLWGLTLGAAIVVPRLALAALAAWRASRLAATLPVAFERAALRRLLRRGEERLWRAWVIPFGHGVTEPGWRGLGRVLEQVLGTHVEVRRQAGIREGDEDMVATVPEPEPPPDLVVALFGLGATPERETHGRFLDALHRRGTRDGRRLLVVVNEAGFGARLDASAAATRRTQRREAWRRLVAAFGVDVLFVDLDAPDLDAMASADALGGARG